MNCVLKNILETGKVEGRDGDRLPLHSETSPEQGLYLQQLIQDLKPQRTLEIGLAYGVSALFICEALSSYSANYKHIIMDPYSDAHWGGIGLLNLERAGFLKNVTFYKDYSFNVLPKLLSEYVKIQFAYIDSTKIIDWLMVDVFYITRLLDIGGVLVLDDCSFPGIRLLSRFLRVNPCFELVSRFSEDKMSLKRKLFGPLFYNIVKLLPFKSSLYPSYNFLSDAVLGVDYHCLVFKKIKEDDRSYDWFNRI